MADAYRAGYSQYRGAGLSAVINRNCNDTSQAQQVIQSYFNGNEGADYQGVKTNPNKLFGGTSTNGYASVLMD